MNVRCPGCNKTYRVSEARLQGKSRVRLRCTACDSAFEVAVQGSVASEEAAAPAAGQGSGPNTTQTIREGELLSDSGKMRLGAPELPAGKRASLAVLSGPEQGKMIPLDRPRMVIGRSDAEIILEDPEISRRHAVLEIYGDRLVVRDLNSTNGTFIGDRKITAEQVENHEEFRVGSSRMMFIVTTSDA